MMNWRDLKVWQKAHGLVLGVYKLTATFPVEEKHGIISQLRRSTASIAANMTSLFHFVGGGSTTEDGGPGTGEREAGGDGETAQEAGPPPHSFLGH